MAGDNAADPNVGGGRVGGRWRKAMAATIACSLAMAIFGLTAPLWIKSPQQLAADAAPPKPTMLTARVERRTVTNSMVLRGKISSLQVFEVTPAITSAGARAVVTGVRVRQGDQVEPGTVLLEVAGRPLIVLSGAIPAYRDLLPGAEGKDVGQLQRSLKDLGYPPGEYDGHFGSGTKRAIGRLYRALGYTPPTTGDKDDDAVQAAAAAVIQAERRLQDAQDALRQSTPPQHPDETDPRVHLRRAVERAQEDLAASKSALADLKARTGAMLPLAEVVFLPTFPAQVQGIQAAVGADVKAPLIQISSGRLVIKAEIGDTQRRLLKPGMPVAISTGSGASAAGTVTTVSDQPEETNGRPEYRVVVTPSRPLSAALAGQEARCTVQLQSSHGQVLAVPIAAIFTGADGATYLVRRSFDGQERRIRVQPGLSGEGYVEITSVAGELKEGDDVIVGADALTGGHK